MAIGPVAAPLLFVLFPASALADAGPSQLTFGCSDHNLTEGFAWAKKTTRGYVMTGRSPEYIPCYWAGYADQPNCPNGWACDGGGNPKGHVGQGRRAFYLRDMAHHSLGAHLLGLDAENANMARLFAASASASRGFFPAWSFGFDGSTYPMDYINDTYFVRELPEPFDLIHRLGGLLDWTSDSTSAAIYNEPAMVNFYRNIFGLSNHSFLSLNSDPAWKPGIARWVTAPGADPDNIFTGVASYNEQAGAPLAIAGEGG